MPRVSVRPCSGQEEAAYSAKGNEHLDVFLPPIDLPGYDTESEDETGEWDHTGDQERGVARVHKSASYEGCSAQLEHCPCEVPCKKCRSKLRAMHSFNYAGRHASMQGEHFRSRASIRVGDKITCDAVNSSIRNLASY